MLWNTADGSLIWENELDSEVECMVFSPDGQRVATSGEDYMVRMWDVATGELLAAWEHNSGLDGIAWSHDGTMITTGSAAGNAWLWDGNDYTMRAKLSVGSAKNSLQFTKDDAFLAVGGNIKVQDKKQDKTLYYGFASLINIQQRKVVREYKGMGASVKSLRISPDQQILATGALTIRCDYSILRPGVCCIP
ncbi:WD40 repeat domain-containing protein [Maribacter sp. 2307ULW6-5]|uniref:WD40 repeat domain-containing protein n=1 Tax=Maribacter sp. 2307ULW6-5 TaxID=3386275 RepID=UPI0039BD18CC